ncbi:MAG: choice-of-anchor D domain-containing protein [Bacteroidetes bacterium]|nr:choice-of-anchor D domain-containing protein [Bacteroidota bacterium]
MKKFTIISFMLFALICTTHPQKVVAQDTGSRDWTIAQSWDIPGKASGLAWDGTYLYFGIYGSDGDHFYRFNPSDGTYQLQFINPAIGDCFGMTWDGSELWITDHVTTPSTPATAIELDLTGNILSTFNLPDHYMSGIAYDAGDFWVGTYYPDPGTIYKVDNTGAVISQFTPPANQIWDICTHGNDLWMVDYNANMIYKTDQTGTVLESHPCENIKPAGIVYDGTYLWYVDGQLSSPSKLYKVDLLGAGTPEINIPITSHNYGTVTIGTSSTWNMEVENVGDADLVITNLVIPASSAISSTFSPPQTITPGGSIFIPLKYTPTVVGALNVIVSVQSTDPINPSVDVTLTGQAVNPGPSMNVPFDTHDYGDVRATAHTRWFLEIENIGDATLTIGNITSNQSVYFLDESVTFPLNIAPLNSALVGVWFNPFEAGSYTGNLFIVNNDPYNNPYTVSLEGMGIEQGWPMGEPLWNYIINTSYDNSPKAIIAIQDITGDTVDDVIICSEDNYIRCFNGNSSGIADVMWEVEIYSGNIYDQPGLTIIEDINADGYEDVIVGTTGGDKSIIAFSGKTGAQIWKHQTNEYGNGGWVYAVNAKYDYNGDGIKDVLASTGDDSDDMGPKRVYCLDGLNGFSIWETYLGGPGFSVLGVEDFTGDGIPDAIGGASNENETQGKVFGISGASGVPMWVRTTGGSSVWALVQLDDITGDGVKDIAAGDFSGNYYYINPSNNNLIFQGAVGNSLILTLDPLNDVNSDGYTDVMVGHSQPNGIVLDGYDGSNVWFQPLADKAWNVAAIDDLNLDGINDVIYGTLFSNNYCYFLNGVDGEELESINYQTPVDALNSIPDIVGDGSMEMVAGGRNGKVYCYSGGFNPFVNVEENEDIENHQVSSNYPNPFTNQTTITYNLEEDSFVSLRIIDLSGAVVKALVNNYMTSGQHFVTWDGRNAFGQELPAGFYVYEIQTEKGSLVKKIAKIE